VPYRLARFAPKIGIQVSDSTVRRYQPPRSSPPSQSWRAFLDNHVKDIVAIDFFVVPTATFRVLYALLIMSHDRRRILHFNVTTSQRPAHYRHTNEDQDRRLTTISIP